MIFLRRADVDFYKATGTANRFQLIEVFWVMDDRDDMIGILGTSDGKLEMLFLVP